MPPKYKALSTLSWSAEIASYACSLLPVSGSSAHSSQHDLLKYHLPHVTGLSQTSQELFIALGIKYTIFTLFYKMCDDLGPTYLPSPASFYTILLLSPYTKATLACFYFFTNVTFFPTSGPFH